ncbi:MAG: hypothetical protein LBE35_04655, partial [Clostridiales bacterium]|nr:hypothetical protein [Clostridiales bacterium]
STNIFVDLVRILCVRAHKKSRTFWRIVLERAYLTLTGGLTSEASAARARMKSLSRRYTHFSQAVDLPRQNHRLWIPLS